MDWTGEIDRTRLLPQLFPNPGDWLFVSGLAGASKDAAALTGDGPNLYTMAGTMGAAVPTGLGMAMSAPDRQVAVITGDGEMMMGIGALITVASAAPANLSIVVEDNGRHGETGGQRGHTARGADLAAIARGAGLHQVKTISTEEDIEEGRHFLTDAPGPRLLIVRVREGAPSAYRRDMDPAACRVRFRDAFLSG